MLINFGIALTLMILFCPSCFLSWNGIINIIPDFLYALAITIAMSYGGNVVENYYDSRVSWIKHPVKRLLFTGVTYLSYAFVVAFIIVFIFSLLTDQIEIESIPWLLLAKISLQPMIIALIIMAIFTTRSWLMEWRKSAIEAEKLKSEKLASQYQGLKDQLNPHFLFNSLNALSNLVYEDADRSAAFIQKLSKIYRYVLDVQNEEIVELEKEVSFAKNYLELQKIRFEDSLEFKIELTNTSEVFLPPLSLQLLLENAIKHNIASQENPLFINILQKGEELWVSNTFQPKSSKDEPSKGIGLENIRLRYQHLSQKKITVTVTENEYLVQLPLLKLSS
ncbi:sensor histidine kinase [Algoriphagus sp.]|uniref:sensor histidine kinase n=1 Tax=Algoriphagus sp. TaxID=1872435 RepID=UPI0025F783BA|nr:sensor histidine kinase [Algoriphagus sp.]